MPANQTTSSTTDAVFTISSTAPSWTGHTFSAWNDGTSNYSPGDSYTIPASDVTGATTKTLTANWTTNSYGVTISTTGNGLSKSANSINVSYGGSNTVTITPSSGYKISGASCTNGYTLSPSANNQTSATTFTISNNSVDNTSTCTFTGAEAITYIQDYACSGLSTGATKSVKDRRDNKDYNVSLLADGKCWMTTNLNIDSGANPLTSTYSNVSSSYNLPSSSTGGFSDNATAYVYDDSTYGKYYSWKAATAGTNPSSGTASYDICPKNWRLPTKAEFDTLISKYPTEETLAASPVNMLYGGDYYDSLPYNQGLLGSYWSSSAANSSNAYLMSFYSSYAYMNNVGKRRGVSARCIRQ